MANLQNFFVLPLTAVLVSSCGTSTSNEKAEKPSVSVHAPLLTAVPAEQSGINFNNTITESPELNYFTYVYAYNGAGVAVGDIDNDGLSDIYFTGNQVSDKLYRNLGGMKFADITEKAIGPKATEGWRTGVSMADVNADGFLDIYVCRSGLSKDPTITANLLYMNNGDGTFTERAQELGVADTSHSTQAAFFDADRDGDLDLQVINHPIGRMKGLSNFTAMRAVQEKRAPTDRFYLNNGGTFTDATYDVGVQNYDYSLGLSVSDLDQDGWPDLYTANDFDAPDLMYMNTRMGAASHTTKKGLGFSEQIQFRTRHISNFGMGTDVADYNNDGLPDILTLDMTADDHLRNKTNMASMSPEKFWKLVQGGYYFQYMLNTLQLNNGNGTWSDIGQLAGIARTDWSWAPLFCDLDNDGWKDLLITNGYLHDVRDNDYARGTYDKLKDGKDFYGALGLVPSTRLRNYLYRNNGDLTFADSSQSWGFTEAINSNGAAYADLDNDGDLDLVINNMDAVASIYANSSNTTFPDRHWLRVKPMSGKSVALGTKVFVRSKGTVQYQELYPERGYQSCVEPLLHFGLGSNAEIDTLEVQWPMGERTILTHVKADQLLVLKKEDAVEVKAPPTLPAPMFTEVAASIGLAWLHQENPYNDFELEPLLPHKQSELGPMISAGDANGDGLDDLFAAGAHGQPSVLWLQRTDGSFHVGPSQPWSGHAEQEDMGSIFFDADGDGDQDLLVLAGGNEDDLRDPIYTQRIYVNKGLGNFAEASDRLPAIMTSAQRAAAADIDNDGDMDLFIGGRSTPAHYPFAPRSYLLVNDGKGHFADATEALAPEAMGPGMVTDVKFADLDGDKDLDLLLCGEWMNVTWFRNDGGHFTNASSIAGLDKTHGWWYSLATADVNEDGHLDIIAGNLGWNSKFHGTAERPIHVYWADFDDNGRHDIVLAKEKDGKQLPVRGRECSSQQCPMIQQKFPTYAEFANADLSGIYTPEKLAGALHLQATMFRSTVFLNDGKNHFSAQALPNLAQVAPINAIIPIDIDGDNHIDLVCAGNNWGAEVETARYDAGIGLILKGNGKGSFDPMPVLQSGFFAWGNVKDLALVNNGEGTSPLIVVANNNAPLQVFKKKQ
ncbi:MAG: VCBS repeat-containing protein [Flavobacteriales bacterium]|nr:VCBS repeat-containing protein [Flavobacteriales bacterium]